MARRRSARKAATGVVQSTCCGAFAALPHAVVLHIFTLAPADARARCAAVCRAWCAELVTLPGAAHLWRRLDLSPSSGLTCAISDAALRGAAALAREGVSHVFIELPWATHAGEANLHGPSGQIITEAVWRAATGC
jgi:hypothetical protein